MGFLARLYTRSLPGSSGLPSVMPKGLVSRLEAPALRRQNEMEDAEISPARAEPALRASAEEAPEEEMMRKAAGDEPGEEIAQTMRASRASGNRVRRQTDGPDEEEIAPLRRQSNTGAAKPDEMDEELTPLRRQPEPEEEEEQIQTARLMRESGQGRFAAASLRREPDAMSRDAAGHVPGPGALAAEGGFSYPGTEAGALFGEDAVVTSAAGHPDFNAFGEMPPAAAYHDLAAAADQPFAGFERFEPMMGDTSGATAARSDQQVTIDHIDVLIHEPAARQERQQARSGLGRSLRARYLRRL